MCDGCWRGCKYSNFRGTVPVPPGPMNGTHGPAPWSEFQSEGSRQQAALTELISRGGEGGVTAATIRGAMHRAKQDAWDTTTTLCRYQGQALPRTTEEALDLVDRIPASDFRARYLGMSSEKARKVGRSLTMPEFLRWWRSVGRQRELDLYVGGEDLRSACEGEAEPERAEDTVPF